jgi:hypothetical protein
MMQSGHIIAQDAQPTHAASSMISAGWCPFLLILSGASLNTFSGQTSTHNPQPLQLSVKKVNFAIFISSCE